MSDFSDSTPEIRWYIAHTYAGYENKVKANLEKIIENRSLQNVITDVKIPVRVITEEPKEDAVSAADEAKAEDESDITAESDKKKEPKIIEEKIFPSYVFVKMIMNDETWHVVRNIRGVTGFVGAGNKALPLSETDFASVFDPAKTVRSDIHVGDNVRILTGLFENFTGRVTSIDEEAQRVHVVVPMLKRETDVELALDEVLLDEE